MKKRWLMLAFLMIFAAGAVMMTGCGSQKTSSSSASVTAAEEEIVVPPTNPLTGAGVEDGFDADALNRRIASFVVENAPDARPQWGMTDEKYSPDIILQAEVEGGITRTLWMYADYNKLPEVIGPMRSARPPFIRFARLFDSYFFHWGKSHTENGYVGANTVFHQEMVSHIDQMHFDDDIGLFDRDHTRNVSSEHTGILYGDKVPAAIKKMKFRIEPNEYTKLNFNEEVQPLSSKSATSVNVAFSDRSFEAIIWNYHDDDHMYHTAHFENDLARDNLLILSAETEYQEKTNYKGTGSSVVYCDYKMKGGKGLILSQGTRKKIKWKVKDHKLILIDLKETRKARKEAIAGGMSEEEAKDIIVEAKLNPGKTWIGWISSNHNGSADVEGEEPESNEESESEETTEE